jgi:hypothetical protein
MKGLEIKYKDSIFHIASDSISGINIVKRYEELYFSISGLDKNNTILRWMADTKLSKGDEITVSVREIYRITEPEKKYPFERMNQESEILTDEQIQLMHKEKLVRFHALENKLKDEELIN